MRRRTSDTRSETTDTRSGCINARSRHFEAHRPRNLVFKSEISRRFAPRDDVCQRGFTLIEIMLVVIIIGILAATVLPRLTGRAEQARVNRAKTDIENIGLALKLYELDTGIFPAALGTLQEKSGQGPYLEKKPVDPWNRSYQYRTPGDRNTTSYDLFSLGKDGVESNDDITNW